MTKEEITECNKLIAEFSGFEYNRICLATGKQMLGIEDCRYHSSWEWLMPVVSKINSMTPEIKMPRDLQAIRDGDHEATAFLNLCGLPISTPINDVFKAVVDFIKWYNSKPISRKVKPLIGKV